MTVLLVSHRFRTDYGTRVVAAAARVRLLALPADPAARLPESKCAQVVIGFFSSDIFPEYSRQFFSAARKAPRLKWLHVFNAGVDHPIYAEMLARGVRLTTSSGSTAEPIAQTAVMGLLALARPFPHWLAAQRRRAWDPVRFGNLPRDLRGQTALILGLGRIGAGIARLIRLLGINVIGVRRGARTPEDPVEELHPPQVLPGLLPRADWLIISCPLTPETRGLVDEGLVARLPKGARIINVARGEIVREDALIAALKSGHLGGAYLDVFATEPLPPESPLWDLPNVLISPHNSAASSGNDERVLEIFLDNLGRWQRGAPLVNEITSNT